MKWVVASNCVAQIAEAQMSSHVDVVAQKNSNVKNVNIGVLRGDSNDNIHRRF